jgi:hypothetical protein
MERIRKRIAEDPVFAKEYADKKAKENQNSRVRRLGPERVAELDWAKANPKEHRRKLQREVYTIDQARRLVDPEFNEQYLSRKRAKAKRRRERKKVKDEVKLCETCDKEIHTRRSYQRFCSRDCKEKAHDIRNVELLRERRKAARHRRRARIAEVGGSFSPKEWRELKKSYNNKCLGCGRTEEEIEALGWKLVPDHIKPIAKKGSNNIYNIQPLCHGTKESCNIIKTDRWIDYRGGFPLEII